MISKIASNLEEVVADIPDGATLMVAGFGAGVPLNLEEALVNKGIKNLTTISNGLSQVLPLFMAGTLKKIITSFAAYPFDPEIQELLEQRYLSGELETEIVPQGILAERVRAGGAGIPAFFSPVGVGTALTKGKREEVFDEQNCVLETAIKADFALLKAYKGDRFGNLVYRGTMRNWNPVMAAAAKVSIVEVEEIVEAGELDPEAVATPGIFIDRVVKAPLKQMWLKAKIHRR